jgi:hypothetical protein
MPTSHTAATELVAELTAHKFTCLFLMKCLSASLAGMKEPARSLAIETIEGQFLARRGEWLFVASPDTDSSLQTAGNRAMQEALRALATELHERLQSPAVPGEVEGQ